MHLAEIIILLVGAILFTVSFFIPNRSGDESGLDEEKEREIIRGLLDKEIEGAKFKIEEATQECVEENRDRMERALDRITNEKMSAVDEYSNTVLEQIHKNHDEVVFMYDMLNNKHTQVKNTAAELNQITKSAKLAADSVSSAQATPQQKSMPQAPDTAKSTGVAQNKRAAEEKIDAALKGFGFVSPGKAGMNEGEGFGYTTLSGKDEPVKLSFPEGTHPESIFEELPVEKVELVDIPEKTAKKRATKAKTEKTETTEKVPVSDGSIDLMFASDSNSANNNDRILALHKEGKSNMAIAKELGLGIGEVKLVIDLFEGI